MVMKNLTDSPVIKRIVTTLSENLYVQVPADSLVFESVIQSTIGKYNAGKGPYKIAYRDGALSDGYNRVKTDKDKMLLEEINDLIELIKMFESLNIGDGETVKKRRKIIDEINNNDAGFEVGLACNDILYLKNRIEIHIITHLSRYIELLQVKGFSGDEIYYRGQNNINWPVKPNIYREQWITFEKEFVEEMTMRNYHDFENCGGTIEILAKMQRHGAPTRLLDITKSPLAALYFACEACEGSKEDTAPEPHGEVILFSEDKDHKYYYHSDEVSILANLAVMDKDFDFNRGKEKLAYKIQEEKSAFRGNINEEDIHKCLITHVKLDNRRIINQQGLFLLAGIKNSKQEHADILQCLAKDTNNKATLIVIPYKCKEKILQQLENITINRAFMYPDIDSTADYLKDKYPGPGPRAERMEMVIRRKLRPFLDY
jgi:hypothetical protein